MAEAQALGRWETAVGLMIAKHSKAIRVYDSILWVEVEHPIWRSELHYRKKQILDILNGKAPGPITFLTPENQLLKDIIKDIQYIDPKSGPKLSTPWGKFKKRKKFFK